ncbi:hypothetical protein ES703_05336 [subsurface metagenome]|nr:T9SS type A sorting domain-containing protein [bacterium]
MLNIGLIALTLCGADILVEPFRIAEAEPGHHQGCLRAAMAPDGHFAVAWVDSLQPLGARLELDLYMRFFDPDGSPLTDAYKITKMVDTNRICGSHLDMDSAGNTVLLWTENPGLGPTNEVLLRLQLFDSSGNPLDSPQTDHQGYMSSKRGIGSSLNNQGEFAIAWAWDTGGVICARRYSLEGSPQGDPFRVHGDLPDDVSSRYPGVALNDAGDLVITWIERHTAVHLYPRFQAFDAKDEPILGWEPMGHRVDDGEELYMGTRPEVYWLDNDRFVVFWRDWSTGPSGRVFSDRGLTRHPIRTLIWRDSLWLSHGGSEGWYSTAVAPNDSFAYTHTRTYSDYPDTSDPSKYRSWNHGAGILGYIQDNEPIRWTNLFEYTPPWGEDTVNRHTQPPAVACCDDRIVWVYSRLNTDTIFEAWAMVTDWDMGIGVMESSIQTASPIRLSASLNRLSYDLPGEASLTLYSADGRRILQETIKGEGIWEAPKLPSGVYFARVEGEASSMTQKVVLIR